MAITEGNTVNDDPASRTEDTMPPRTLEALRGSIEKWERVVSTGANGNRWSDCPLCDRFIDIDCRGCPVAAATGQKGCRGSPYTAYKRLYDLSSSSEPGKSPEVIAAAQDELAFLKSLLPSEAA